MTEKKLPMDITEALPFLAGEGWRGVLRRGLDNLLGLPAIREGFGRTADRGGSFFVEACREYRLTIDATDVVLPKEGPVLVVANHPFGGADAFVLGALCQQARPDMFLLANAMVAELPGIGEVSLPLSILGSEDAERRNASSLRRALRHLKHGGLLAAFPSGEVARWRGAAVEEGPWSAHLAALAQRSGATVVPLKFFGQCPPWFHLLGALHPMVRTALLPNVLIASKGHAVECRAGEWIDSADFADLKPEDFASRLRKNCLTMERKN